jgi:isoleucyl-tRNA synthetase
VHYLLVPEFNEQLIDQQTEQLVNIMQKVILLGRTVRDRKTLPLRHPVKELVVIVEDYPNIETAIEHVKSYIYEELNVKQLKLTKQRDEYGIQMKPKPNFKVLALKAKDKMKTLSGDIEKMTDTQVQELREKGKFMINNFELSLEDVLILPKISAQFSQYEADFDENVIVLLDVTPDQEMIEEGALRDLVNRVQRLRKEYKIVPTDDIIIYYQVVNANSNLDNLLKKSIDYLETNIKKPVKLYDNTMKLNVKGKQFEVNNIFKFLIFIYKLNYNFI